MVATRLLLIFVLIAGMLSGCRDPGPGSVSGQVKATSPDGSVRNVAGAQVILRGQRDTYTTVSTEGEASGDEADASYNYRFERVPPGTYTMAVTPPAGSGLQPEAEITLDVKADEQFPQSVLLLPEGTAKPRPLAPSEVNPGEVGYVNPRGERVVYPSGGIDTSDLLLMYLLFRNPPLFGHGGPPIMVNNPVQGAGSRYRVQDPPTTTRTGQRVTTRPPSVPGQGATRPGAAPAGGAGPSLSGPPSANGSSPNGSVPKASVPGQAPSRNGSSPDGGTEARPPSSAPSQGVSRPSSSGASRPSAPAPSRSGGGRSSGGGRR